MTLSESSYSEVLRPLPKGYWPDDLLGWGQSSPCPYYPRTGPPIADALALPDFSAEKRSRLQAVLTRQMTGLALTEAQQNNLMRLTESHAYTVCTGQQIHVGGGPMYVGAKLASVLHWAQKWNQEHSHLHLIPVFWMATEDHDFEEIKTCHLWGKTYEIKPEGQGAVGRMSTQGLAEMVQTMMGDFPRQSKAIERFWEPMLSAANWAEVFRIFLHEWGKDHGLLILDPDDAELKSMAQPLWEAEITAGICSQAFQSQSDWLVAEGQAAPAMVRPVNAFLLSPDKRERITELQSLDWASARTAQISPNVLLRPLYQQIILPNVAYLAGPSEFRYWLQTSAAFEQMNLFAPYLMLREVWHAIPQSVSKKINKWSLQMEDFFQPDDAFAALLEREAQSFKAPWNDILTQMDSLETEASSLLYRAQDPFLPAFKKDMQNLKKAWRQALQRESSKGLEARFGKEAAYKIFELRERCFSWKNPIERSMTCLELALEMGSSDFPLQVGEYGETLAMRTFVMEA